jgi:hypothetical protein
VVPQRNTTLHIKAVARNRKLEHGFSSMSLQVANSRRGTARHAFVRLLALAWGKDGVCAHACTRHAPASNHPSTRRHCLLEFCTDFNGFDSQHLSIAWVLFLVHVKPRA